MNDRLKETLKRLFLKFAILQAIILMGLVAGLTVSSRYYKGKLANQLSAAFRPAILTGDSKLLLYEMSDSVVKNFSGLRWMPESGLGGFLIPDKKRIYSPWLYSAVSSKIYFDAEKRVVDGKLVFYYNHWPPMLIAVAGWMALFFASWLIMRVEQRRIVREYNASMELQVKESMLLMAAQVAHDIRSPLAALGAATKGLDISGEQRTLVDGSIGRIHSIADDLLKRYRAPGAEVKSKVDTCSLSGLIEQVLAEKRVQHKDKAGIGIEFRGDDGLKAAVDKREFQRIISNLVNNAVEAFEKGGTVAVTLSSLDGQVILEIKDDGKGIPPEILSKLGQKGETHGKSGGTGLGLYHARTSVESWGGKLKMDSTVGEGTAVTITLPAAAKPAAGLRAVLLDDDPLVHMNWKMAAKTAGAELKLFKTPAELLDAAETLSRDIPLYIDSELGAGVKGEDIAKKLHERGFSDITMATGHDAAKFAHLPWLKTAGKEPPWS